MPDTGVPLLLHLETSSTVCSVALSRGSELLAWRERHSEKYSHSENLQRFIDECLEQANSAYADLDGVSVSQGPGSYTGLRIGVSSAKGICYACGIPLLAVNTLQGMAKRLLMHWPELRSRENWVIRPMLDARRNEVFTQRFTSDGTPIDPLNAEIIEVTEIPQEGQREIWLGDGAWKFRSDLESVERIAVVSGGWPSAVYNIPEALDKWHGQVWEDVAYFVPQYLKDFVAIPAKKRF